MTQNTRFHPQSIFIIMICCIFLSVQAATAQTACPASVLLAMARAGTACQSSGRDQACLGSGRVNAVVDNGRFSQPGDTIDLDALRGFQTMLGDVMPVVMIRLQANLLEREQRNATLIALGDVQIENQVQALPELIVTSTGTLNIRAIPEVRGDIITRVALRQTVIANGRTGDAAWLRVFTPGGGVLGWVSMDGPLSVSGSMGSLAVVRPQDVFLRPFQWFGLLHTGLDDALCEGAPSSGLLVQAPSVDAPVELTINGLWVRFGGTAFLQLSGEEMTINVLDGQALSPGINGMTLIPAGARARVFHDDARDSPLVWPPEPFDPADLVGLPVNLLPTRIRISAPLAQVEIEARNAAYFTPPPTPAPTLSPEERGLCQRMVKLNADLYAGPGQFYEVVNAMTRGQRIQPVYQTVDPDGVTWWQLRNTNWIRASSVEESGECQSVPVIEPVRPPSSNTLSLETCFTSNGPLRTGQQVTITFVSPAFESLAAAQGANRIDPGTIRINNVRQRVSVSSPSLIAQDRYVRTYSTVWQAAVGSHRIVGQRLSYIATCDITVPVG